MKYSKIFKNIQKYGRWEISRIVHGFYCFELLPADNTIIGYYWVNIFKCNAECNLRKITKQHSRMDIIKRKLRDMLLFYCFCRFVSCQITAIVMQNIFELQLKLIVLCTFPPVMLSFAILIVLCCKLFTLNFLSFCSNSILSLWNA